MNNCAKLNIFRTMKNDIKKAMLAFAVKTMYKNKEQSKVHKTKYIKRNT